MTETGQFDDPLSDIDPVMEQAFSVSGTESDAVVELEPVSLPSTEALPSSDVELRADDSMADDAAFAWDSDQEELGQTEDELDAFDKAFDMGSDEGDIEPVTESVSAPDYADVPSISDINFPDLSGDSTAGAQVQEGVFSSIPVTVSVELGRASLSLKEVYELSEGSIIELERLVGEPLDLLVNGQVIAQGEVVAIDNKYGLRVKSLVSNSQSAAA